MRQVVVEHEEVADAQGYFDDLVFVDAVRPVLDTVRPGRPTVWPSVPVVHDVRSASEPAAAGRRVRQGDYPLKPLAGTVTGVDVPVQRQGLASPLTPWRREPA